MPPFALGVTFEQVPCGLARVFPVNAPSSVPARLAETMKRPASCMFLNTLLRVLANARPMSHEGSK